MNNNTMSPGGVLARMLAAQALVLLTANPSRRSYIHWGAAAFPHLSALQVLCGLLLLIVRAIYATATLRSLGWFGVGLVEALFAALIWRAVSQGWLHLTGGTAWSWLPLVPTRFVRGCGLR